MEENIRTAILSHGFPRPSYDVEYHFPLRRWPNFKQYATLCRRCSRRMFTYEEHVLDAFSSTTNALTKVFPGGFVYAVPKVQFSLSLLWLHSEPAKRREWSPSWSWIGWNGVPAMIMVTICDPWIGAFPRQGRTVLLSNGTLANMKFMNPWSDRYR
jgi:hypothetical protein